MTKEEALFVLKHGSAQGLDEYFEAIRTIEQLLEELKELLKEKEDQIEKLDYELATAKNFLNYYVNGND